MQLEWTNRNGVFRRSVMNPLFNSLFVNECRNDYYFMWRLQNNGCWEMMVWIIGYSFSTLPQSFGVTLSLPTFTTKNSEEEEQNLLYLYTYLINLSFVCWMKSWELLVCVASSTKHPHLVISTTENTHFGRVSYQQIDYVHNYSKVQGFFITICEARHIAFCIVCILSIAIFHLLSFESLWWEVFI